MFKRIIFPSILLLALTACQTTSSPQNSLPVTPLSQEIKIGDMNAQGARGTKTSRVFLHQGGQKGYIETTNDFKISATHTPNDFKLLIEVIDVSVTSNNLDIKAKDLNELKQLEGTQIALTIGRNGKGFELSVNGQPVTGEGRDQMEKFGKLLLDTFLAGKTVSQGQKVFDMDLAELFGLSDGEESMQIAATVIGQTVLHNRPVVVLKSVGSFSSGRELINLDGLWYVDTFTGLSSYSEFRVLLPKDEKGQQIEVIETMTVKF